MVHINPTVCHTPGGLGRICPPKPAALVRVPKSFSDFQIKREIKDKPTFTPATGTLGFSPSRLLTVAATAKELVPMGFFSSIAKIGGSILGGIGRAVGILPAVAARAAPAIATVARRVAPAVAGGLLAGAAFAGGEQLFNAAGEPVAGPGGFINPATGAIGGLAGGNGRVSTFTTVTTIDNMTGQPIRVRNFTGRPFLMSKEVAHLKTVARKLSRAHGKVPRRTVKQSLNAMIVDTVKDKILHDVQRGASVSQKA